MTDESPKPSVEVRHDGPVREWLEGGSTIRTRGGLLSMPTVPKVIHRADQYIDSTEYKKPVLADRPCHVTSHTFSDGHTVSSCLGIRNGRRCRYASGQGNTLLNCKKHSFSHELSDIDIEGGDE